MTSAVDPVLDGRVPAGLYRVVAVDPFDAQDAIEGRGWDAIVLGPPITDKTGLLDAVAAAARFPDWTGRNWDALADALCDLSWLPAEAHVVVWPGADALAAADPGAATTALEILAEAVGWWRERGHRFTVIVEGSLPPFDEVAVL